MKPYSRKQFIKSGTAAAAALLLNACGVNTEPKAKDKAQPPAGKAAAMNPPAASALPFDLVDKNDERYEALRKGFNKRIDKHPQAIAVCATAEDVAAALKYARANRLPVAVKSGGHSMEGFSCNDDGMVINLSKMNKVELRQDKTVSVGPGCTLSNLYDAILPRGILLPAGSCATVGVGGLALGGGYGIFARKYGLTCDHLLEATMVDGMGNIIKTKDDAELLWALKGGGTGNFSVVTEMVFRTHIAPTSLQAHYFKSRKLTAERAAGILQTWMEVAPQLPESCFSGFVLNGSTLNILVTNYEPNDDSLKPLLDKLAAAVDEFRSSHIGELSKMVRNYYGIGRPLYFRNSSAGFFKDYSDVAPFINAIFEQVVHTPGMIYQVNTLGGEIKNREFEKLSSYPHRAFDFISELQAYWSEPAQDGRLAKVTTDILKLTEQNGITRQYVNYCSLEFSHWEKSYYGDNYSRLQAIKRKYDADNIIRHPQSVRL